MGPVPTSPENRRPSDNENSDQEAYEQDGWAVGFEVEMNGVGIEAVNQDSASTSSEGEDAPDSDNDEDGLRYSGYQTLPSAPGGPDSNEPDQAEDAQSESQPNSYLPSSALAASSAVHLSNADFKIEHQPRSEGLVMDDAKIDAIKSAMSGFLLPPSNVPQWASQLSEKEWKEKVIERIGSKQSSASVNRSK